MSDKENKDKNQKEEQPWDRQFGEQVPKERQYSRSARNKGGKAVAPLTSVLLFVFLIVAVAPILFMMWFYWASSTAEVQPRTANEVMLTKVAETTTTTTASETTTAATTAAETTRAVQTTTAAEATTTAATTTTAQQGYTTYTVQAGETLYRIAVNHGMDVDTLKSINGLTSNNISPGMQLRVTQSQR